MNLYNPFVLFRHQLAQTSHRGLLRPAGAFFSTPPAEPDAAVADSPDHYHLSVPSVEDMESLGRSLAGLVDFPSSGDVIFLFGDLGVGKTALTRSIIRTLSCDPELEVPSPSYLLSQMYQIVKLSEDDLDDVLDLHHLDLYRLEDSPQQRTSAAQLKHILDLKNVFENEVAIVEWPDRLHRKEWPASRLDIHIEYDKTNSDPSLSPRLVRLLPHGELWKHRLRESEEEN